MSGTPRTVVVGLDSFDPALARELAAAGRLPAIAELLEAGAAATTLNPYGLFVGALWPTTMTALSAERVGYHSWLEVDPVSYERQLNACELNGRPFWRAISDAGHRVAVADVPHGRADEDLNGIEITEWGCHDRHHGLRGKPDGIVDELVERHGLHPVLGIDPFSERHFAPDDEFARAGLLRTPAEDRELAEGLLAGVDAKLGLAVDLLEREPWDLYMCVFGESHAAGHHFWHHHDRRHPRHDPAVAAELGDPLVEIYERLDSAVGELASRCGPDTTFAVLLSHGMAAHHDGTHLLDEVLRRLDAFESHGPGGGLAARSARRAYLALPGAVRRSLRRPAAAAGRRTAGRRELQNWWGETADHDWSRQRWFNSPNNTVYGGVRINLRGREAEGIVAPGDLKRVCERLAADLLDLVNVETGAPVINAVNRAEELYDRRLDDTLPDLFLDWNHDAPVSTVWSPKTGLIHGAYDLWRTGDHRLEGMLIARGPGIEPGSKPPLRSIDIGPTLAARLGVQLGGVDGEPVPWLADDARSLVSR
jgi:predicted AlkP superfamily phosphohydrolase/phosphomutase